MENRCGKCGVWKIRSVVSVTTHSAFSTLRIFHTPHFPHSTFSALCIFHTLYFLHSSFSTFRTPPFPLNRRYSGVIMLTNRWFICIIPQPDWFNIVTKYIPSHVMQVAKEKFKGVISWDLYLMGPGICVGRLPVPWSQFNLSSMERGYDVNR